MRPSALVRLLLLCSATAAFCYSSASIDSLDARLAATRIRIAELEEQEAEVEDLLVAIHEELEAARELYHELSRQETELSLSVESVQGAASRSDSAGTRLRENLESYVVYIYSHRHMTGPEAIFGPGGLATVLRREAYLDYLARQAANEYSRLSVSTDSLFRYRDSLAVLHQRVTLLRERMEEVGERIYLEEARQAELRADLQDEIAAAQDSASALEAERQRLTILVDNLRSSTSHAGPVLPTGSPDSYFERNRGMIQWPAYGSVTRGFGVEVHPVYGTETFSDGICISTAASEGVSAVHGGSVLYSSEFLSMGQMVVLDHGDGFYTVYGYMSSTAVSAGEQVSESQRVGTSGTLPDGSAGVYFEIRSGGQPVDPRFYLE